MLEIIKEIPGPYFLLVYSIFAALVIFIAKKYAENDSTKDIEMPEPSKVSPVDIALLNKGIKGALIVTIFNLWRNKKIEIKKTSDNVILRQLTSDSTGLNPLESLILKNTSQIKKILKNITFYQIKN